MKEKRKPIPLLRGDVWEAITNTGHMMRHIRSSNEHAIYYSGPYGISIDHCQPATFRRWIREWAATLTSSQNWERHMEKEPKR